ncbi:MAG TPA: FAD:protein FMN transferase [Pseudomonas sp.]|nr:FAD:protein FMN transferase [Pseudomonas sp.]
MGLRAVLQPVIAVASAAALTGCLFSETVETFTGPTMGSTYSIKYVRTADAPAPDALQQQVEALLAEIDRQVSTYRRDSLIEAFNDGPAGCQPMPEPVLEMARYGLELSERSEGAFDLTLEPLLNLWGFGPRSRGQRVPTAEEIAAVREQYGHRLIEVRDGELCKARDAVQVDFNSIAAGQAVDRIVRLLREQGIGSYLVEVTGELKAEGRKPDGAPWRIAIEAPQTDVRAVQQILELDGLSVSTSGDYRNYFEQDGRRYSHTLDPRQAAPITHTLAAVTVLTPSAMEADGLSTLLMVLGPEQGMRFAEAEGIAALFVTREGDGFVSRGSSAFDALFPTQGVKP